MSCLINSLLSTLVAAFKCWRIIWIHFKKKGTLEWLCGAFEPPTSSCLSFFVFLSTDSPFYIRATLTRSFGIFFGCWCGAHLCHRRFFAFRRWGRPLCACFGGATADQLVSDLPLTWLGLLICHSSASPQCDRSSQSRSSWHWPSLRTHCPLRTSLWLEGHQHYVWGLSF